MKALLKSFGYAFAGIFRTLRSERNMRIHLVVCAYMYGYLLVYDFFKVSRTGFAILFLANALVMMGEMINTALENVVDLVEQRKNEFCKVAKDAAAGAVLIGAIFSVLVGIALLYQPQAFRELFAYYRDRPVWLVVLAASLAASMLFIFRFGKKGKGTES
ncbi:MAG: diacylglycerol kinase family protein [Clostridia bacterium]|nr:diacylglycerol kinase family protein [Clostridia bacterium]